MKWLFSGTLLLLLMIHTAVAQQKDSTRMGVMSGVVRDSTHDYELPSATVAIYQVHDSGLVSYQLSDVRGKFQFKQLPAGIPLRICITYVGYQTFFSTFTISSRHPVLPPDTFNLAVKGTDLAEIAVTIPPVQLNGDTLEFNAAAFKLDPAAQTEDLLKLLPGVTVWSDGSITVNGKPVSRVLVEGKPFFGGDTKVATQNIPKDAVDKIQVYHLPNTDNPIDSITEINIRLQKNKRSGYFGKVAAGGGTDGRYDADANVNLFTPCSQFTVAGTGNNVNKVAHDVKTILRNSTYKGIGANIDYQPELSTPGYHRGNNGGVTYQHDFIPDPGYFKNDRFALDYFLKDHFTVLQEQTQTTTRLNGDSTLLRQEARNTSGSNTGQSFSAKYDKKKEQLALFAHISYEGDHIRNNSNGLNTATNGSGRPESSNRSDVSNKRISNSIGIETGIAHQKPIAVFHRRPGDYDLRYSLHISNEKAERSYESQFTSFRDSGQNSSLQRHYDNAHTLTRQELTAKLGDLSPWIFGYQRALSLINIQLQNSLEITTAHARDLVHDANKDGYTINNALTNNSRYTIINEMPALHFTRNFVRFLDNRYQKTFTIDILMQSQFWYQQQTATHLFQQLQRRYQRWLPNASLRYHNRQFSAFEDMYRLEFATSTDYPSMQQLVPLVDSSDLYNIQTGNPQLQPADKQELSFTMNHSSKQAKQPFDYTIRLNAGIIHHYFAAASNTDSLGRSVYYLVNANSEKHTGGSVNVRKAFKRAANQLEINISGSANISRAPNLVNQVWHVSNILNGQQQLGIAYTYGNLLSVNVSTQWIYYRSRPASLHQQAISGHTQSTVLSAGINGSSRLSLSSHLSYNRNTGTNSRTTDFVLWNAHIFYRLGKMKSYEVKLSALDLLHQNKGIYYSGSNNVFTYSRVNVQQQYFMLTVAWFPRRFGK
jgi:Outer membrane protein beta-barrel family